MLPDDHDKPWQLQQNMYEKIRGGYFNQVSVALAGCYLQQAGFLMK